MSLSRASSVHCRFRGHCRVGHGLVRLLSNRGRCRLAGVCGVVVVVFVVVVCVDGGSLSGNGCLGLQAGSTSPLCGALQPLGRVV